MKSYFRFLSRNKLYTLINVVGLVVSLMFIILLGDYTWRQFTIDSWHKQADRIVLLGNQDNFFMWPQVGGEIKAMCPEVEQTCAVMSQSGKIKYGDRVIEDGDDKSTIMLADSTFFRIFDYELTQGNRHFALDKPDKCVITEHLAHHLFGDKNPIGESVQITGERHVRIGHEDPYDSTLVYTVSAVAKNFDHTVLPNETQIIVNMERYPQVMGYKLENYTAAYGPHGCSKVFLMLHPGTNLESKKAVITDYMSKNYYGKWEDNPLTFTPLKDVMFAPQNNGAGMQKGDKSRLHILQCL